MMRLIVIHTNLILPHNLAPKQFPKMALQELLG